LFASTIHVKVTLSGVDPTFLSKKRKDVTQPEGLIRLWKETHVVFMLSRRKVTGTGKSLF